MFPILSLIHNQMMKKQDLNGINPNRIQSIGLDVAKEKIDICLFDPSNEYYYQINNDYQAIKAFSDKMKWLNVNKEIPFILESTWDYHLLLAKILKQDWWNVKEINPIIMSNYIKHTIRWTKTDKTDSQLLSKLWIIEWNKLQTFNRSDSFIQLKKKTSSLKRIEKVIQEVSGNVRKNKETYKKMWWEIDETIIAMENVLKELESTKEKIKKDIESFELWEEDEKQIERLDSIIGITYLTAKIIYASCWDKKFKTKRSLLAYFWLDARLKQSGQKAWTYKMSKRWEPFIRKILFQSAFCWKQHYKEYEDIYLKQKEKWKHHFVCVLSVAKKIVYIMWVLMKEKRKFNPNYQNSI